VHSAANVSPTPGAAVPPPPQTPIFQVKTYKHTGALIFWMNQTSIVTGSYEQCDAALSSAVVHCLVAGWWSILSVLLNPISLLANANSRKQLRRQAADAQTYAAWWSTYYGAGASQPVGR